MGGGGGGWGLLLWNDNCVIKNGSGGWGGGYPYSIKELDVS